jgi:hypothetical protein
VSVPANRVASGLVSGVYLMFVLYVLYMLTLELSAATWTVATYATQGVIKKGNMAAEIKKVCRLTGCMFGVYGNGCRQYGA